MKPVKAVAEAVTTSFGVIAMIGLVLSAFAPIWVGVGVTWFIASDQHRTHSPVVWVVSTTLLPVAWLTISHICDFVIKLVLAVFVGASRASEIVGEAAADFAALALLGWGIRLTFFTTYAMSFLAAFIAYVLYRLLDPFLDAGKTERAALS